MASAAVSASVKPDASTLESASTTSFVSPVIAYSSLAFSCMNSMPMPASSAFCSRKDRSRRSSFVWASSSAHFPITALNPLPIRVPRATSKVFAPLLPSSMPLPACFTDFPALSALSEVSFSTVSASDSAEAKSSDFLTFFSMDVSRLNILFSRRSAWLLVSPYRCATRSCSRSQFASSACWFTMVAFSRSNSRVAASMPSVVGSIFHFSAFFLAFSSSLSAFCTAALVPPAKSSIRLFILFTACWMRPMSISAPMMMPSPDSVAPTHIPPVHGSVIFRLIVHAVQCHSTLHAGVAGALLCIWDRAQVNAPVPHRGHDLAVRRQAVKDRPKLPPVHPRRFQIDTRV